MPITNDLELPIRPLEPKRGPAVDARRNRKEENDNDPAKTERFRKNYEVLKGDLHADLREIMKNAPKA